MSHFLFRVCACAPVLLAAIATSARHEIHAGDFIPIYGGPTYSDLTGGYRLNAVSSAGEDDTDPPYIELPSIQGAVNDAGVAVGNFLRVDAPLSSTEIPAYSTVMKWSATLPPTPLDPPSPNAPIVARAINNAGVVAGAVVNGRTVQLRSTGSSSSGGVFNAARWDASGALTMLSGLGPSSNYSIVAAINNQVTIIGIADAANPFSPRAVRWEANSTNATELTAPNFDPFALSGSQAFAINNSNVVSGFFTQSRPLPTASVSFEAVRWDAGQLVGSRLEGLSHPLGSSAGAAALSINDSGSSVGYARVYNASGVTTGIRPVYWDPTGTPTQLGDLGTVSDNSAARPYALGNKQCRNNYWKCLRGRVFSAARCPLGPR